MNKRRAPTKPVPKPTTRKLFRPIRKYDDVEKQYLKTHRRGQPHTFNSKVAIHYDVNIALIINLMIYWCHQNAKGKLNFRDGYYWTYNSAPMIRTKYPYLSERSIRIAINRLLSDQLLVKSDKNYNKHKYDKTSWYRINEDGIKSMFSMSPFDVLFPKE
ncbi:MAG: hypothetical protein EOP00_15240 [Pedobacter sp.]|nr:MAG: hypothetical protein EOP00_15240 [Pedobacter sp.]